MSFPLIPFRASGASHSIGLVPDPGSTSGSTKFLREDGAWEVPAGGGDSAFLHGSGTNALVAPTLTNLVPTMTSNTAPIGTCLSFGNAGGGPGWQAFDNNAVSYWSVNTGGGGTGGNLAAIGYTFTSPTEIGGCSMTARATNESFVNFMVEGSNDAFATDGVVLKTVTGEAWEANERKVYTFTPATYTSFRIAGETSHAEIVYLLAVEFGSVVGFGNDGDEYRDDDTGKIYANSGGTWTLVYDPTLQFDAAGTTASRTISTTAPLTGGGDLSVDRNFAMPKATALVDGYLGHTDFAAFLAGSTGSNWYSGAGDPNTLVLATPAMTSNTTPTGFMASASASYGGGYAEWHGFNQADDAGAGWEGNGLPGWLKMTFASSVVSVGWGVRSTDASNNGSDRSPQTFKIQGFNGSTWDDLDARTSEPTWGENETRGPWTFANSTAYSQIRLYITAVYNGTIAAVNEFYVYKYSAAASGPDGSYYRDTDTGFAYQKASGVWVNIGAIFTLGQLPGTTANDDAGAGKVGEYDDSTVASGSAVSLTTATAANVTSISLTAGDWEVDGVVAYTANALTVVTNAQQGASSTSATLGGNGTFTNAVVGATVTSDPTYVIPTQRFSLATTTTIYLVAKVVFTTSTLAAYGQIRARRVR